MATARNGGVNTQPTFAGSAWLQGQPRRGGGWGLPFLPNQPRARAGGVLALGAFAGSSRWTQNVPVPRAGGVVTWVAFAGSGKSLPSTKAGGVLTWSLFGGSAKLASPVGTARAGGVVTWSLFYGATKPAQVTTVSRAGGVLTLGAFRGGTLVQLGPTVVNQTPSPGSTIYPGDTVSFDVTDVRPFLFLEVQVDLARREVIHDGDQFLNPYLTSIRVPIPGGWRYQVRRSGGWNAGPTFRVRVYDTAEQGG